MNHIQSMFLLLW